MPLFYCVDCGGEIDTSIASTRYAIAEFECCVRNELRLICARPECVKQNEANGGKSNCSYCIYDEEDPIVYHHIAEQESSEPPEPEDDMFCNEELTTEMELSPLERALSIVLRWG